MVDANDKQTCVIKKKEGFLDVFLIFLDVFLEFVLIIRWGINTIYKN